MIICSSESVSSLDKSYSESLSSIDFYNETGFGIDGIIVSGQPIQSFWLCIQKPVYATHTSERHKLEGQFPARHIFSRITSNVSKRY